MTTMVGAPSCGNQGTRAMAKVAGWRAHGASEEAHRDLRARDQRESQLSGT